MDQPPLYRTIEHTADLGIEVESHDLPGIFTRSGLALFDLMIGLETIGRRERRRLEVRASEPEELLVAWLNELIYVSATEHLVFSEFTDVELGGDSFSAWAWGERFDPTRHAIEDDIKAATYHGLKFRKTVGGWAVTIIFDV